MSDFFRSHVTSSFSRQQIRSEIVRSPPFCRPQVLNEFFVVSVLWFSVDLVLQIEFFDDQGIEFFCAI